MDFGKVSFEEELNWINFKLPEEPKSNSLILASGNGDTQFYLGAGSIRDKLNIYARTYNSIELNTTYYTVPGQKKVDLWTLAVPEGFRFMAKLPQTITHLKRLKNVDEELNAFLTVIQGLGNRLGGLILMPHPQMKLSDKETIKNFIANVPANFSLFLELRQPEWFASGYDSDLLSFLIEQKRGTIITDTAGRRDVIHMRLSKPECFIRFVGNGLHKTDYTRIDNWIERIKYWQQQGLEKCYFYVHQDDETHGIVLLDYLKEKLN